MSYKSLVNFFDRLQYHLQRVCDFYDSTEFSNTAGMKLLLLKVMAEGLSAVVDYFQAIRATPISRLIVNLLIRLCSADHSTEKVARVLTRRDLGRIIMPRSAALTGEKSIGDTSDILNAIQEVGYQVDDSALAPQVGAHGSHSFFMLVLTHPPIYGLKNGEREIQGSGSR